MRQLKSLLARYPPSLRRHVRSSTPEDALMGPPPDSAAPTPLVVPFARTPLPRTEVVPLTGEVRGQDRIWAWSSGWLSIVTTPAEVGSHNAQEFWAALANVCASHALTIADMTGTVVCGHDAVTVLLMALRCTDASGGELWLAVSKPVDRLVSTTAIGGAFPRFPRLSNALASLPARRPDLV